MGALRRSPVASGQGVVAMYVHAVNSFVPIEFISNWLLLSTCVYLLMCWSVGNEGGMLSVVEVVTGTSSEGAQYVYL